MDDLPSKLPAETAADWSDGAAYVNGRFVPIGEAAIPVTDWGYRRSDVTYDVVSVWNASFFRLDDHLRRFQASMASLRLSPPETIEDRGTPTPGAPRHPANCRNHLVAFAIPFVWVVPEAVQARGAHLITARTPRIPEVCVDPRVKNFHWGDLTRAQFEAGDAGADNAILLDLDGFVTEGPGFNVFMVSDGTVVSSDRGALEGITRLSVYELCREMGVRAETRPIPAAEIADADEIFLATTAGGIMPASRLDGRIMGNDRPGPISAALRERFWARRREGWHATPIEGLAAAA